MKQILLMIAVVALVGCGATKPTPPKATPPRAFTNTLGMKFVPVPGTGVVQITIPYNLIHLSWPWEPEVPLGSHFH
jgi:hypothetical protein